jgi:predicted dehydrogenase
VSGGPVGVGVVGAGVISDQYLRTFALVPDVEVRFVADLDLARAAARADEYDVARSGSVAELLADDGVQIVVNLTVPRAHTEVALQALAAGKHVWNEKPFALDRESGREVLDAARAAGLRVGTAPDTFLGPGIQTALRLVRSGAIGTPIGGLTLLQGPGPESWHPDPDFLYQPGAGPLFDIGPYYLTALVQLLGPFSGVAATASRAQQERTIGSGPRKGQRFPVTVATHVGALYGFAGGANAQSVFSFDSPLVRRRLEVTGTEATVVLPDPNTFGGSVELHRADGEIRTLPPARSRIARGTGVLELARAIRAGEPERASGELAFHVLDTMIATVESATGGTAVPITSTVEPAPVLPDGWDPFART